MADAFYDRLPEAGFEVRDEQIYMAYQLERAYAEKSPIFAEAGVGTGKTLVYLLYAVLYARHVGQPAVIACADESLIEQLVKPEGDLAKLARHLDLSVDARLGKSPDKYLCLVKLDRARLSGEDADLYQTLHEELPSFVYGNEAMQSFYAYGDRKQYPHLNDDQWGRIGWDAFQDCFSCELRHRCGQTLSRERYRQSPDLIVCSHDFYMEHVWTYESRKREGQLPLLPEHSSVVFDEGHLLEAAAQKALTYRLKHAVFEALITRLLEGEIRESLAVRIEEAIDRSALLFDVLAQQARPVPGSDRMDVVLNERLRKEVTLFQDVVGEIEEELVFESELYTLNGYHLRIVEEHLDMLQKALSLFRGTDRVICWAQDGPDGMTLVVMPRTVKEVLRERVFDRKMPIVFSSATMSVDGSFAYLAESLGIDRHLSFSVSSPYEYEGRMEVLAPAWPNGAGFPEKLDAAVRSLVRSGGRTLLLFADKAELRRFKNAAPSVAELASLRLLFEGDREISDLIADFQRDETSVLCAVSLWEGLDVPGPSLSNVIVWSLPFPPRDPVYEAKRQAAADPYADVDLPYMLLRLKQGMGRLIRSRDDRGEILLLGEEPDRDERLRAKIEALLPNGVTLKRT